VSLFVGLAGLLVVGWLAGLAVTQIGFVTDSIDRPAIDWLARNRTDLWNSIMRGATRLGSGAWLTILMSAAVAATYAWTKNLRWSGFVLIASVGGTALDKVLKPLVGRDRPDFDRLVEIGGKSFPSGHATGVTALWLAVGLVVHLRTQGRFKWIWWLCGGVILLVCVTRPYLGVHYPTDVIAGAALSAGWVALCARSVGIRERPPEE
jgi:undecaprenyl-diphosphatase